MMPYRQSLVGSESEFGLSVRKGDYDDTLRLLANLLTTTVPILPDSIVAGKRRWYRAGSGMYVDLGGHFEFTSAECANPAQLAAHEWSGPFLMRCLYNAAIQQHTLPADIWLFKNNTDKTDVITYGNHLNLLMPQMWNPEDDICSFASVAMAMVVTLPLLTGAGTVFNLDEQQPAFLGGKDYAYRISARSEFMCKEIGNDSTRQRAIFLNRNDHHVGNNPYWRLQILSLDANILPIPIGIKAGLLANLVMMWASGEIEPLTLLDPVAALRQVSLDWRVPLEVKSHRSMTAVQIQQYYLSQIEQFVIRHHLWSFMVTINEAKRQLAAFAATGGVPEQLFGSNDWVTKWMYLQRQAAKGKKGYWRAAEVNLKYHGLPLDSRFHTSIPMMLLRRFGGPCFLQQAQLATWVPPTGSRAIVRGAFIDTLLAHPPKIPRPVAIDWATARYNGYHLNLSDPFSTNTRWLNKLAQLLASDKHRA